MKKGELGNIFLRHLIMAIPWGLVFLVVFFIAAAAMKQQVKEAIQYSVRTAVSESVGVGYSMIGPVKQNIKEGFEFAAKTAGNEIKDLLHDPQVKQDMKETMQYTSEKLR